MADKTGIEWTDATWNPTLGCSLVSPGCTNCYAMTMAARIEAMGTAPHYAGLTRPTKAGAVWTGTMRLAPEATLTLPLRWKRGRRIFVNSMSDLFHEDVPDEWIDRVFAVMALSPQHTYQILTKRSARMRAYVGSARDRIITDNHVRLSVEGKYFSRKLLGDKWPWPLPNVWLGVSAEDQRRADERIPDLLATPAAIRFVSAEPLLGPIDFGRLPSPVVTPEDEGYYHSALDGGDVHYRDSDPDYDGKVFVDAVDGPMMEKLDQIIVGGESGKGARPMHPDWARSIRDQCAAAGTAFFFKQWGGWCPVSHMDEEQIDACYVPAPQRSPDASRRERKPNCVLHSDGKRFEGSARYRPPAFDQGSGAMTMFEIGKKAAGGLLDGVAHNGMPEVRS